MKIPVRERTGLNLDTTLLKGYTYLIWKPVNNTSTIDNLKIYTT